MSIFSERVTCPVCGGRSYYETGSGIKKGERKFVCMNELCGKIKDNTEIILTKSKKKRKDGPTE